VLGLLPDLKRDALGLLTTCVRDYGDLTRVRLGLTPAVVLGHPELAEEVLVTRNHDYRKGQSTRRLGSLLGRGLLLSEGEQWLRQRRLMQPAFHRQRLARMAEAMIAAAVEMAHTWRDGETRAINQEMLEVTLRIVGRTLFGTEVSDDLDTIRRTGVVLNEHFRSRLYSLMILLPDSVATPGNRRYQQALRELNGMVFRIIAERRARDEPGEDLLGMLLAARDETDRGMTDRQLRDEVLTLLLAGHDTTALALTWAWVLLSRHPEAEARLQHEIDQVLGSGPPSPADLPRLKYADAVVTETLRLYPTAWAIAREAVRDTQIGGTPVARGTTVLIVPWVMHRDPRFFEAPEEFRPERWLDGLADRLPRLAYLPFGAGQRVCIGSSFAQIEATLVLSTLAREFSLQLADPMRPVEPWPVVTLRTRADVPMKLTRRRSV
jgi:cytochrome P450